MMKHLDDLLESRAVWILVELLEHDNTKEFVMSDLKKASKQMQAIVKNNKEKSKGL